MQANNDYLPVTVAPSQSNDDFRTPLLGDSPNQASLNEPTSITRTTHGDNGSGSAQESGASSVPDQSTSPDADTRLASCHVVDRQDCTPAGFRWLSLYKLQYEDPYGRRFAWEAVERQRQQQQGQEGQEGQKQTQKQQGQGEGQQEGQQQGEGEGQPQAPGNGDGPLSAPQQVPHDCSAAHQEGVAVLALINSRSGAPRMPVVLQYRPPVNGLVLELPAGLVDPGEDPATAAVRELKEETGYTGRVVRVSGPLAECPGISSCCCQLALVHVDGDDPVNVDPVPRLQTGEALTVQLLPYDQLLQLSKSYGTRTGCKTASGSGATASAAAADETRASADVVIDCRLYSVAVGLQLARPNGFGGSHGSVQTGPLGEVAEAANGLKDLASVDPGCMPNESPRGLALSVRQAASGNSNPSAIPTANHAITAQSQARDADLPTTITTTTTSSRSRPESGYDNPSDTRAPGRSDDPASSSQQLGTLHMAVQTELGGGSLPASVKAGLAGTGAAGSPAFPGDWTAAFLDQLPGLTEAEIQALLSDQDPDLDLHLGMAIMNGGEAVVVSDHRIGGGRGGSGCVGEEEEEGEREGEEEQKEMEQDGVEEEREGGLRAASGVACAVSVSGALRLGPGARDATAVVEERGAGVCGGRGEMGTAGGDVDGPGPRSVQGTYGEADRGEGRSGRGGRGGRGRGWVRGRGRSRGRGGSYDGSYLDSVLRHLKPKKRGPPTVGGGGRRGFAGSNAEPSGGGRGRWGGPQRRRTGVRGAVEAVGVLFDVGGWAAWAARDPVALGCGVVVVGCGITAAALAARVWLAGSSRR